MRRGMAFADVLDETLASQSTTEGLAVPPPAASAYTRPVGFFLFTAASQPALGGWSGARRAPQSAQAQPVAARLTEFPQAQPQTQSQAQFQVRRPQPRPIRVTGRALSPRQMGAFRRLVDLGADIAVDFTPEELRSAYRRLARRYHPDHHPETSEAERQQLARLFAQASDSYAELQDALAPAA